MIGTLLGVLAQLTISVNAPDSAIVNEAFNITIVVRSPSLLPPTVVPPAFPGFVLMGTGDVTNVVREGTGSHAVREMQYRLIPRAEGASTIGSFEAKLDDKTMRTAPFRIVIRAPLPPSTISTRDMLVITRAKIDPERSVSIAVTGTPDTVYIGQQATYQVAVFVDEAFLRQRTARNPTFTPPDLRGTLSYELPPPRSLIPSRQVGNRSFRPHVYQRAIFPLVSGKHVVPAAMLDYTLPVSSALFSSDETHSLRADSVVIVARPLPAAGQPTDFNGAVGTFRIEQALSGMKLRVGDPFAFRVHVIGTGNIKLLPRPKLDIPWADVIEAGERVELDLGDGTVRGTKEFEWVITPRSGGPMEFPAIRYPYFDPFARKYAVANGTPETLNIVPGSLLTADDSVASAASALSIRKTYHGERPPLLWSNPLFLVVLLLSPLPAIFALGLRLRRRPRIGVASVHALTFAEPGDLRGANAIAGARRLFLASVESRLGLPRGLSATEGGFRAALLRGGVSRETTDEAEGLVRELDAAVFGAAGGEDSALVEHVARCFRMIDAEAARPAASGIGHMVPVAAIFIGSLLLQAGGAVSNAFDRGVASYSKGFYSEAAQQFLLIARVRPRAPDAWMNLGAASLESGDTATAMVAWQRALRLDQTAGDVRASIDLMSQSGSRDANVIPAVPADLVTVLALVAWVVLWGLIYRRVSRRTDGGRAVLALCGILLTVFGAWAFEINRRVGDKDIAVVMHPVLSHAQPSLESPGMTRLSAGEVVRLTDTQRDWSRVDLDGHPAGWLHHSDLMRVVVDPW